MEDPNRLGGRALMELVGYTADDDAMELLIMMVMMTVIMAIFLQ